MVTRATRAARTTTPAAARKQDRDDRLRAAAARIIKCPRGVKPPSVNSLSEEYSVSRSSLQRVIDNHGEILKMGRPTALTPAEEQRLADYMRGEQQQGREAGVTQLMVQVGKVLKGRHKSKQSLLNRSKPLGRKWRKGWEGRNNMVLRKPSGMSAKKWAAAMDQAALELWYDTKYMPKLHSPCIRQRVGRGQYITESYLLHPERVINFDETGIQNDFWERVYTEVGAKHAHKQVAANDKHSITCLAVGTAEGTVLAPYYLFKGKVLTHNVLGGVHHYPQSGVAANPDSHMMNGRLLPLMLEALARQIPGGVSRDNRALIIADGHISRVSDATHAAAARLGFDILLLPPNCTPFIQPWDQLFSTVKNMKGKLMSAAALHAGLSSEADFKPRLSQVISIVDAALHYSVGFSKAPLAHAFRKTGLFPPSKEQMLQAARALTAAGKQPRPPKAWKPMEVGYQQVQEVAQRSAQDQPGLWFTAQHKFLTMHELAVQVNIRAQQRSRRGCRQGARA